MSEDRRRMPKKCTGTVPKVKQRNDAQANRDVSNNLAQDGRDFFQHKLKFCGNPELLRKNFLIMENGAEVPASAKQNGRFLQNGASTSTPSTSASASRRNSTGATPKSDNVAKFPDRKHIEDRLAKIREYLNATSSLITNMKSGDHSSNEEWEHFQQMYKDLKDSESKLTGMLLAIDIHEAEEKKAAENGIEQLDKAELERRYEQANKEVQLLQEQENVLLNLQLNAESQLRDARHMQNIIKTGKRRNERKDSENSRKSYENSKKTYEKSQENQRKPYDNPSKTFENENARNAFENLGKSYENENARKSYENDARSYENNARSYENNARSYENENARKCFENESARKCFENENARKHFDNENARKNQKIFDESLRLLDESNKNSKNESYIALDEQLRALNIENNQNKVVFNSNNVNEHVTKRIENLQEQIGMLRDSNENRHHLIQLLDNRDFALKQEHVELQGRLLELQNKKNQVDQLVSQLQSMNEESDDEDVGAQVRRIVTMKDQLAKLKDMLDAVKQNESLLEIANINESDLETENFSKKSDNLMRTANCSESNRSSNRQEKQVNKSSIKANERERIKLQEELQSKKRELEELMYKHKAVSSNLNQDVHSSEKNDFDSDFEQFRSYRLGNSSESEAEDYRQEEEDFNSSLDTNNLGIIPQMPILNYPTSNYTKRQDSGDIRGSQTPRNMSKTPERIPRGPSLAPSLSQTDRNQQESGQINKKLELIRSVCESMLNNQTEPTFCNNLTPSPLYSEARPPSQLRNVLNVVNNVPDFGFPQNNMPQLQQQDFNGYQSFLATNTLQTQAFMLNTLNQCCQMLWLQQRELAALKNTVSLMLEKYPQEAQASSSYMNSPSFTPTSSDPRLHLNTTLNGKSNAQHVSSATSLPNLTHMQVPVNQDQNNLENNLNNAIYNRHNDFCANNVGLPSQIWNGQALNNKVAPGNRANNYWDNFRSYSRQNLLSTKSNDGITQERSQNVQERQHSYVLPTASVPKRNTEHQDSGNASIENTPRRRRTCFKTNSGGHSSSEIIDIVHNIPPDVLNINQIQKSNERDEFFDIGHEPNETLQPTELLVNPCRHTSNHQDQKESLNLRQSLSRNLWQNNYQDIARSLPTSYSCELKENIFRGVSNLISANEERPHFLVQLLRGLQKVQSDQMRCKTLQYIQALLTNPEESHENRQEQDLELIYSDYRDVLMRIPPKNCDSSLNDSINSTALDIDYMLSEVLLFLNENSEEIFQFDLIYAIKDILLQSRLTTIPKEDIIQRYFGGILECSLTIYRGQFVKDIKANLLKTIEDLLKMDFRKFVRDQEETGESTDDEENAISNNLEADFEEGSNKNLTTSEEVPQVPNGDLAEADQSHLELEEEQEEEGAVGGVLNIFTEHPNNTLQIGQNEPDNSKIEFSLEKEESEYSEGLDRVPTRLTISKSRSNTPNKDCCPNRPVSTDREQF